MFGVVMYRKPLPVSSNFALLVVLSDTKLLRLEITFSNVIKFT